MPVSREEALSMAPVLMSGAESFELTERAVASAVLRKLASEPSAFISAPDRALCPFTSTPMVCDIPPDTFALHLADYFLPPFRPACLAVSFTKRHGRTYRYYNCHRATRTGYHNCEVKSISAGIVEGLVKDLLRKILRSPEVVQQTLEAVHRIQTAERSEMEAESLRLKDELAGVMTCGQQLMKTLSSGENAFVRGELDRLDRRRSELEVNLRVATERIEIADQTPQATEDLARELKCLDNIWDNLFPGEQQQLVRTIFEQATLHTDRFEITLRAEGVQHIVGLMVGNDGDGRQLSASQDSSGKTTVSVPIQPKPEWPQDEKATEAF